MGIICHLDNPCLTINLEISNLSQLFRSIVSHFNGTSTECGSSFRCNNNQWPQAFYPSADCTTNTPHHHHHYPPQYNQQFGVVNPGNHIHYNCRSTVPPPHGRLQKSLSFAFQTPSMMNEAYHQSYQNQLNSINYPERSSSRWRFLMVLLIYFIIASYFSLCLLHLQMWHVSTATPAFSPSSATRLWHELKKQECSRRSGTSKRRCSLELQSNRWTQLQPNSVEATDSSAWANNNIRLTENHMSKLSDLRLHLRTGCGCSFCLVKSYLESRLLITH